MKKFFLVFFLLFSFQTVFAVDEVSLYQAEVPVRSQSDQDRDASLREGLNQVLIKVSGDPAVISRVGSAAQAVMSFVEEYAYFKPDGSTQSMIRVKFDRASVQQLLQKAKAPIWGTERALIVVWATWEPPGRTVEIIDSASVHPIRNLMNITAEKRGIPLVFPIMDLSDMNQVSVNDVVTMAVPRLQAAAKRYHSDRLLIVRVMQLTTGYGVQAKLMLGPETLDWNFEAPTLSGVLDKLINQVSDKLAHRYSAVVSDKVMTSVTLKIVGITHHEDFEWVKHYFKTLAIVDDVDPMEISGEAIVLQLNIRGTQEALEQSISEESKLAPEFDSNAKILTYRWNP